MTSTASTYSSAITPLNGSTITGSIIAGYRIIEQLYAGSRTLVYRAIEDASQRSVVIKLLQQEYPTFTDLLQFRNQYTITKSLNIPGIVRPYRLASYRNSYALIMEDCGGISLREWMVKSDSTNHLIQVLSIALQLAEILHSLHQHRVIHKDIKPANLLIHPETNQVKLIDFSIASLLPQEVQEIKNPNGLEGTLAYLSPEQTGRMNRGIDYRADFYALGVTLFELFAGELPFPSDDPMELLHCHIAKPVPSLVQYNIPAGIADIVLKLMAKNAEDRYQSALGLKHDLAHCLFHLNETGKIEPFQLGTRDLGDRFLIPEKLYGRTTEVNQLLAAFDRVAHSTSSNGEVQSASQNPKSELMLVAGFSGIGKTAVINEVHKPIVRQRGYFIKGKYDQFQRNIPFSAFVQALKGLIIQLLSESSTQLATWKAKILAAVGENGQVIVDVIPELEEIIGKQPVLSELCGSAAQNRFNLLFHKFIQVFTTPEHPLVIFLDDLQWADSASLNLLKVLMGEASCGYLLILGAYRDNEVFPAHPLMLTLEQIRQAQAIVHTITLPPLTETTINQFVADTLSCTPELAQPLTQLVYQKTHGNPFFSTQFLRALYEGGWIQFHPELRYWQCNLAAVRQLSLSDDVVEFMASQLQKLPPETQSVLKLAACIGSQFDLNILAIVSEQSETETATALWRALQEGLILPISETYKFFQTSHSDDSEPACEIVVPYRFLHDRVQQAAYFLIPEAEKPATHLRIGQLLLTNNPDFRKNNRIFEIVHQLNIGYPLIIEPTARLELAELNVLAGRQAKQSTAYASAVNYFQMAMELLTDRVWQQDYRFALDLYTEAIEATYLTGDFIAMDRLLVTLQRHAKTSLDCVKAQESQIEALVAQGKLLESLQLGLQILAELGIQFPAQPDPADYTAALERAKQAIGDRTPTALLNLPLATDGQDIAIMRVLVKVGAPAYLTAPELYPLLPFCGVELSARVGLSPASAYLFACYGLLHCAMLESYDTGEAFGQLALDISTKLEDQEFYARVFLMNGLFITHWKAHIKETLPLLQVGYTQGLETGDYAYASYSAYTYAFHQYFVGHPLSELISEMESYQQALQRLKQGTMLNYHTIYHQIVLNLLGQADSVYSLVGKAYNELEMISWHQSANDYVGLAHLYINKLVINTWFGHWADAISASDLAAPYLGAAAALITVPIYYFYDSLARLGHYRAIAQLEAQSVYPLDYPVRSESEAQSEASAHSTHICQKVAQNLQKLETWAHSAPMNYQHKLDLVQAEWHWCLAQKTEAIELYDRAIAGAYANGYIQEAAFANELAAQFYLDWGKEKVAASYMQEAYYAYARWGAKAKIDDLEQRYPDLLYPILQKVTQSLNSVERLTTIAASPASKHPSLSTSRRNGINATLDFATILKASQTLSETIHLEELLHQLTQIILRHSGGDRCALILPAFVASKPDIEWQVRVIATPDATELCSEPLENNTKLSDQLPVKLIQYVKNTQTMVVINQLETHLPILDDYLMQAQPASLLCLPVLNQGQLIAIVSLENSMTSEVFMGDCLEILQIITAQAAISLKNAQIYYQLEQTVQQRTQELQDNNQLLAQALQDLQQTQAHLIQTEKMSSLGQLVAGIAHEINNPISFIYGNLDYAREYYQTLLHLLQQYAQEYPVPSASIQTQLAEIDFIQQDLPHLLDSMQIGANRISKIVLELRNFARLDESDVKLIDVHTGIESTLLIVQHRGQANHHRPEIQINKHYADLPQISCYAKQLNQVFVNILMNAFDAIDAVNPERWNHDFPPQITIRTQLHQPAPVKSSASPEFFIASELIRSNKATGIIIRILDNGVGIPAQVKSRIFDPFFTTKSVGQGTGLGLSESYAIVLKHNGCLDVFSEPDQGTEIMIFLPLDSES